MPTSERVKATKGRGYCAPAVLLPYSPECVELDFGHL
jgi:hypothetical protein